MEAATSLPPVEAPSGPLPSAARIEALDYVRGLAVLGILLVNMPLYAGPLAAYFSAEQTGSFPAPVDRAALWLIRVVAESKFYTLFSFLFGVGFGVQVVRADRAGTTGFAALYRRRLLVLLGLGLVHLFFLWIGDVLHLYAAFGFVLLLFRHRAQNTLLAWALGLTLVPYVMGALFIGVRTLRDTSETRAARVVERDERRATQREALPEIVRVYAQGSRSEVHRLRTRQAVERLPMEVGWGLNEVLVLFLLGLWLVRTGVLDDLPAHLPLMRQLFRWGIVGVFATVALAVWRFAAGPDAGMAVSFVLHVLGHVVARPLHALFYAAGLLLLLQHESWRRRLAPLAATGRMALTNYLGQTVICATIFNGVGIGLFGLGLYGRVGPAAGLVLTVVIWGAQAAFSTWWLARYRFGPLEWVWRSLTYGRLQPL